MAMSHHYQAQVIWDGNAGDGTASYAGYGRQYRVLVSGKPELSGSADPLFHGLADRHNPEDLFLASIAACHMLTYLALCSRSGVQVVAYQDEASGRMVLEAGGGGRFEEVVLHPLVTIAPGHDAALAQNLHSRAHQLCFIANSCSVPIGHEAKVKVLP
jgi:organic hydroperoxide reductase OsmC/OhrA